MFKPRNRCRVNEKEIRNFGVRRREGGNEIGDGGRVKMSLYGGYCADVNVVVVDGDSDGNVNGTHGRVQVHGNSSYHKCIGRSPM